MSFLPMSSYRVHEFGDLVQLCLDFKRNRQSLLEDKDIIVWKKESRTDFWDEQDSTQKIKVMKLILCDAVS